MISRTVPCLLLAVSVSLYGAQSVEFLRTPNGGIQPQALLDDLGVLHLIYYQHDPKAGDIFYVRSSDMGKTFSEPLRVNSQAGAAIAMGNMRGAQLALGRQGRVHVAWNGSMHAKPQGPSEGHPMLYSRLNDDGKGFQEQRNLMTWTGVLDGGGSVAADGAGNVWVVWHGAPLEGAKDEGARRVWVAHSKDDGGTFDPEIAADTTPSGACGCCGLKAMADGQGQVCILYRTASRAVNRDMRLLLGQGSKFRTLSVDEWSVNRCPASSAGLALGPTGILLAWESKDLVFGGSIPKEAQKVSAKLSPPASPGGEVVRKYPVIAQSRDGKRILAWTEGMSWGQGGSVVWQIFDGQGRPLADGAGRRQGVPAWSLVAAIAKPDGNFVVIY